MHADRQSSEDQEEAAYIKCRREGMKGSTGTTLPLPLRAESVCTAFVCIRVMRCSTLLHMMSPTLGGGVCSGENTATDTVNVQNTCARMIKIQRKINLGR